MGVIMSKTAMGISMICCKITVGELRYQMTGRKSGCKTGIFHPLLGWEYMGHPIYEIEIGRYGIVKYRTCDGKLIGCFDNYAFLDD
jgi:hypothetical protein